MSAKAYVADELLFNGRAYGRGEQVPGLDDATRDQLIESGQLSTTKPRPKAPADTGEVPTETTLADFSDEDLLAEVSNRGLVTAESKVDYAELTVEDLQKLAEEREIEVSRGDGKKGDPLQADYVAALEAADAADNA